MAIGQTGFNVAAEIARAALIAHVDGATNLWGGDVGRGGQGAHGRLVNGCFNLAIAVLDREGLVLVDTER